MEIGDWLRRLGLEQYAAAFRDNAIDERVLPSLTAEDLKDLGVTLVGHRRRLLDAIAGLGEATEAAPPSAPSPSAAAEAERRQLTVLFCDVVGSTELAARLDPEDLRAIIAAYHRAVAEILTRFGGFVAKYMGDGVLAYFGYPQAHEEDAERAVRAALAIVDGVARLALAEPLQVRIGIATGLAVVGDLIGEGAAQEQAVVGETPNLAARLQALAEPNAIVIGEATRRQVGGLFELRDLGAQALKGFAAQRHVWRVVGDSGIASRFEALRSGKTPLVGREEELELLLRRWQQAKAGEGRAVLISAEPGIGKSRLAEALDERIAGEPHTRLRYFCSPHHQDSAFYPMVAQLERAAGFARDDSAEARRQKLAALFAEAMPDELSLLGELLSLPAAEATSQLELTPQHRKEKTFAALLAGLGALARKQPVLMLFEDLHWMDPTSRELLDRTIAAVERLPVLLIATFRPEFQPPWTGLPHVTMLALNRLGRRDGAALVERLAGNAALPADLVAEVVERTDGVPLFLEEVTKALLESAGGPDGAMARGLITGIPGARLAVPAPCKPRSWRGSTGSGSSPRKPPRSAPRSAASSPTSCWRPPRRAATAKPRRRWPSSSPPASSSSAARRPTRSTSSSTPWCRTPPTARCCAVRAGPCTPASLRRSRRACRSGPGASPKSWPIISPKPAKRSAPPPTGSTPAGTPRRAPPISRRPRIWRAALPG